MIQWHNLENSIDLDHFVKDGGIYLVLKDAINLPKLPKQLLFGFLVLLCEGLEFHGIHLNTQFLLSLEKKLFS